MCSSDLPFQDVTGADGQPVEYARNLLAGHAQVMSPVLLPDALNNQPYVSLRWKYYHTAGVSGPRAQLRLDDILVMRAPPSAPGGFAGVSLLGPGQLQFSLAGAAHRTYGLEVSTDWIHWAPLGQAVMDIDGRSQWLDPVPVSVPVRFYRLRVP